MFLVQCKLLQTLIYNILRALCNINETNDYNIRCNHLFYAVTYHSITLNYSGEVIKMLTSFFVLFLIQKRTAVDNEKTASWNIG